jgi:hypothetical protein
MPTELVNLELEEVSLVDMGDDPLAKVALYKRSPEGEHMDNETNEEIQKVDETTEKGYMKEEKKIEIEVDGEDDEEDMMEEDDMGGMKKPTRKSWKAEALAFEDVNKMLLEEIETYKVKVAELEAAVVTKAAPAEEMMEVEGEMVAKSAIPTPVLKKLEEMQKAIEVEALRKRAEEVLPNFKGTAEERGKLLKSVGADESLLALLKAADAAFAGVYQEVGKTDAQNDLKTAAEKLKDMTKAYQTEKGEKSFEKAYAAIVKTAQGRALVLETYKN